MRPILFLLTLLLLINQALSFAQNDASVRKIGMIVPLTGDAAYFGTEARRGAEIAAEELGKKGAAIELVFEDDKCLPKDAVSAYRNMLSVHNVDFIIGPACTGSIQAVAPLAKGAKRPLLAVWDAGSLVESAGDHVFSLGFNTEEEGVVVANHIFNQEKLDSVALVWEEDQYAVLVKDSFQKHYESLGGKIISSASISSSETDTKSVLTKILSAKPKAIFLSPAYTALVLVRQLRALGFSGKIFGQDTFSAPNIISSAGDAMQGLIFADVRISEQKAQAKRLAEQYRLKYQKAPESLTFAAFAYDSVKIAAMLPKDRSQQLLKIASLKFSSDSPEFALNFEGFAASHMSRLTPKLFTITDGKILPLP